MTSHDTSHRYSAAVETTSDGFWIIDIDGKVVECNGALCALSGYDAAELLGLHLWDLDAEQDRETILQNIDRIRKAGSARFETRHRRKDGSIWDVEVSTSYIDENGGYFVAFCRDISQRKLAEAALRDSEERFSLAMEATADGLWDWDIPSGRVYYSPSYWSMLGYDPDALPAHVNSWKDLIHPDDVDRTVAINRSCISGQVESFEAEFRMRAADDRWHWIMGRGKAVKRDEQGQALRVVGTHTDINDHKLLASERVRTIKLLELVNSNREVDELLRAVVDFLRSELRCSAVGVRLQVGSDYPIYESSGFPPEFLASQPPLTVSDDQGNLELDEDGHPILECLCGAVIRKKLESLHGHGTPGGSFWTGNLGALLDDPDLGLEINRCQRGCSMAGYESVALIPLRHDGEVFGLVQFNHVQPEGFDEQLVHSLEHLASSLALGLRQRLANQNLRESEERFRRLFENAPLGYQSLNIDGDLIELNDTWSQLLGYTRAEALGRNFADFLHPDFRDVFRQRFPRFQAVGTILGVEFEMIHKDGREITVAIDGKIGRNEDGSFKQSHCVLTDITEQKRVEEERHHLEAQLRHAQKMETVGRLAGGVAHDFNNKLATILGNVDLAMSDLGRDHPLRESLEEIQAAAHHSADLTQQLLGFARKQTVVPQVLDLNQVIERQLKLVRRLIGENIDLIWLPGSAELPVCIDPNQIDQILTNLLINARDAIEDVGRISVETEFRRLDTPNGQGLPAGDYARLRVSDTGTGMDTATLEQIFDPFFTTKDQGAGTGLGLATVYGIVHQNNGDISARSRPQIGTTFTILLPISEQSVSSESPRAEAPTELDRGQETILLVEDEEAILNIGQRVLSRLGYRVLTATSPESALAMADQPIDLLLTDVLMPGMNGRELAERFRRVHPDLKCMFMSGYSAEILKPGEHDAHELQFLQKPFSNADLARKVRAILDR